MSKSDYDDFSRAKFAAFVYLGRRAMTEHEMRQKLLKKEYPPDVCEKTIEYLLELKYIDDADYAQRYINDAINIKKHGISRIKQDLRRKGISAETIDSVLSEIEIDNSDTLRELISKKCEGIDLNDRKQKNRLIGYLLRRGYRYDEIYSALRDKTEDLDFD